MKVALRRTRCSYKERCLDFRGFFCYNILTDIWNCLKCYVSIKPLLQVFMKWIIKIATIQFWPSNTWSMAKKNTAPFWARARALTVHTGLYLFFVTLKNLNYRSFNKAFHLLYSSCSNFCLYIYWFIIILSTCTTVALFIPLVLLSTTLLFASVNTQTLVATLQFWLHHYNNFSLLQYIL